METEHIETRYSDYFSLSFHVPSDYVTSFHLHAEFSGEIIFKRSSFWKKDETVKSQSLKTDEV